MEKIAENIYVETNYEGVNVGAILTSDGVIAIDAPSYTRQARDWAMRLNHLHPKGVQFVILTDYDGDRILNTRWFNAPLISHQVTKEILLGYDRRYPAVLLESLTARNPERGRELSHSPVQKTTIGFDRKLNFYKENVDIELTAVPGPTPGNIIVSLPHTGILFSGDIITTNYPPNLAAANSEQWLKTLAWLQKQSNITQIVPGRGELCHFEAIDRVYQYIETMRSRISSHLAAERPLADTAVYFSEFISLFPNPHLPLDWLRSQIQQSLAQVYNELKIEKDGIVLV